MEGWMLRTSMRKGCRLEEIVACREQAMAGLSCKVDGWGGA
jgi:hypothetical protein